MSCYGPRPSSKTVRIIVRYVAKTEGVPGEMIMGRSHRADCCRARRMVILRLWRMRRYSKAAIARSLGLDHTTIVYHTMRRDKRAVKNRRDVASKIRSMANAADRKA